VKVRRIEGPSDSLRNPWLENPGFSVRLAGHYSKGAGLSSFPLIGETYAVLSALSWAVATVLFVASSRQLRPEAANLFKTTFSAAMLIVTLLVLRGGRTFHLTDNTEAAYLALSGFLGISIADTLYFLCLRSIGAWRTLVISCLAPPITAVLAAVLLNDPMGMSGIAGMSIALVGVILAIIGGRRRSDDGLSFTRGGIAVGVTMSVLISFAIILAKVGTVRTDSMEASTLRIVVGVAGILLIEAVRGKLVPTVRSALRPPGIRRLIAASVIGTYIAYILFIAAIRHAHPGVAVALAATAPAFVIPLSMFVLKERVSPLAVAGTGTAIAGILILFLF